MTYIPGMFPSIAAAASVAVLTTLTQIASNTSTAATITGPAEIITGDLLVMWDWAASPSPPAAAFPSGFTQAATQTLGISTVVLSAKIANGSEANAALSGMTGSLEDGKAMYVFRGNIPITEYTVQDLAQEATGDDPSSQIANASEGVPPLIVIAAYASGQNGSAVDPRTFSPAKDGEVTPDPQVYLAYKIYNSSPADVTIDMADEGGANFLISCYIECS